VGTGSIVLACQYFNAFTFGGDLDIRVLKGYGVGRKTKNAVEGLDKIKKFDIFTNFYHYEMPVPEFFVMDCSKPAIEAQPPSTRGPVFDSIVCDPPYGVRARSQKVGVSDAKKRRLEGKAAEKEEEAEEEEEMPHFSMKEHYDVLKVYDDLLENASKVLRPGGRLVFLFHTDTSMPPEKNKFPSHPAFEFICSSENNLTKCRARHLITLIRRE
jgi:tRNA (guanine10-N2)-methyltransferase